MKKYWKYVALVVGGVVGYVLLKDKAGSFIDDFRKVKKVHEEEVKAIEDAHEEERVQKAKNLKNYTEAVKKIEEEYAAKNEKLDRKKKKEIKRLVDKHGNDPGRLAEELSSATGFRIVLPEE